MCRFWPWIPKIPFLEVRTPTDWLSFVKRKQSQKWRFLIVNPPIFFAWKHISWYLNYGRNMKKILLLKLHEIWIFLFFQFSPLLQPGFFKRLYICLKGTQKPLGWVKWPILSQKITRGPKQVIKKFLYLKSVKLWSHSLLNALPTIGLLDPRTLY